MFSSGSQPSSPIHFWPFTEKKAASCSGVKKCFLCYYQYLQIFTCTFWVTVASIIMPDLETVCLASNKRVFSVYFFSSRCALFFSLWFLYNAHSFSFPKRSIWWSPLLIIATGKAGWKLVLWATTCVSNRLKPCDRTPCSNWIIIF